MAQTIAVQRGTTTTPTDGSTKTTLFTQSSGVATRVIVGGITASYPTNDTDTKYVVFINVNGSGNYIPVILRANGNSSTRYITTFPNSDSAIGASLSGKIPDGTGQSGGASIGSSNSGGWATSIASGMTGQIFQQGAAFNQMPLNISPGNFWIANGDSLVIVANNSTNSASVTQINYHFVTVTET